MNQGSWLRNPTRYRPLLEKIALCETEYLNIVSCLDRAFPASWVEREVSRIRAPQDGTGISRAYLTLRPRQPDFLGDNPLPEMLAGKVFGGAVLCELIRLGQDLRDIAHLDRVSDLIESVKRFHLYDGALFEVEVLAEFARAGLRPIKLPSHKQGPDFEFHVRRKSFLGEICRMQMSAVGAAALKLMRYINESQMFGKFAFGGFFHVRVEQPGLDLGEILSTLKLLEGKTAKEEVIYQRQGYTLTARRGAAKEGYSVTWWEDVRNRVERILGRKARRSCRGPRNIIVLDLRGAIQPYYSWIPGDRQKNVSQNFSEALDACADSLKGDGKVAAVVLWLPRILTRARSQSQAYRAAFQPDYRVLVDRPAARGRTDLRSALRFCMLPDDLPPEVHDPDRCCS